MIVGTEMKGGGRIDIEREGEEWILKLHTGFGEVCVYRDRFANFPEAFRIKRDLEDSAGELGGSKLWYDGKDILWFKEG